MKSNDSCHGRQMSQTKETPSVIRVPGLLDQVIPGPVNDLSSAFLLKDSRKFFN